MKSNIDFNNITPCGECCDGCQYKIEGKCKGCRQAEGKFVKMWSNGCDIYKCCVEHKVYFCGLCKEFPCQWLIKKIGEWNSHGIENLKALAKQYKDK